MNKPLLFTTVLMSAALVAGAAVDADNIYHRIFPETKIVGEKGQQDPGRGQSAAGHVDCSQS